jgi:uncharacterized SAM-binding protein YcdF (DUF218 family)
MDCTSSHVRAIRLLRKVIVHSLAVIGAVVVVATCTPLVSWWAMLYAGTWDDSAGEVMVVLAADQIDAHMIGRSSYWRSVYAVWVWKEGGFRTIVISGERSTTQPMADFIAFSGVPRNAILLEPRSATTRENAVFTADLLRQTPGKKVLLTSDFHMFRARRAFNKAGMSVLPRPFPDALKRSQNWRNRLDVFFDLMLESCKIIWYAAHGWI